MSQYGRRKKTTNETIKDFQNVHGDKYDYSKVNYINSRTKVEILCLEHGSFWKTPELHLSGYGCNKCNKKNHLKTKNIVKDFKKVHDNKYDYSKVNYIDSRTKVIIICYEHGEFLQTPEIHKTGNGCPKCSLKIKPVDKHLNDFKKIHSNKYNYSKVKYISPHYKIEIICPEHGSFFQTPANHKRGHGCPICAQENSESKGERRVREFLESNNISFKQEVKLFENYRFDFYLEDLNTIIEYDGKQHFEPVEYFGGLEGLKKTQERDKIKEDYCLKNNIRIIRIKYSEDVEEVLKSFLKNI